jgi:hypothetical protein
MKKLSMIAAVLLCWSSQPGFAQNLPPCSVSCQNQNRQCQSGCESSNRHCQNSCGQDHQCKLRCAKTYQSCIKPCVDAYKRCEAGCSKRSGMRRDASREGDCV